MKTGIKFLTLSLGVFVFMACEKVIEVPLNESDRELVVEAVARSVEGESYVKISKSGSVYDDSGFEKISTANVTITDKDGVVYTFSEDDGEPGTYRAEGFVVTENNQYELNVVAEDLSVVANSTSLTKPVLDSLSYLETTGGGFGGAGSDTTYLVFYHYTDNGAETNYYRIRAWVNGEEDEFFYLGDDQLGNGQPVQAPIFGSSVGPRDTVLIELSSIDKPTHLYLTTLASTLAGGGPFAPAPANPVTNLSEGIGYFGAFVVDTMSIVMP
ncbi:DUF4249 domain-containing protein [Crocinitomix algicola]|uniref:DUF4249 domain-containing protein n=1 Tax=Crocinitomix algicola TaxID=1740263 RepID=UPI00087247BA|nr:DUF4249 domain-containing protein [Crocinitomix algicola]